MLENYKKMAIKLKMFPNLKYDYKLETIFTNLFKGMEVLKNLLEIIK